MFSERNEFDSLILNKPNPQTKDVFVLLNEPKQIMYSIEKMKRKDTRQISNNLSKVQIQSLIVWTIDPRYESSKTRIR